MKLFRFVVDVLTTMNRTCIPRFSRRLVKGRIMLLLGFLLTVVFLNMYTILNVKIASGIIQGNPSNIPIRSKPDPLKSRNISVRVKYFPDHTAHDYPLSILPDPYIISNKEACRNMPELKYIVIVISASDHFNKRNNVRQTWGNVSYYRQGEVKVVFILGRPKLDLTQKAIEAESREHGDIVQGKFIDTYRNLTHKAVLAIRWVNEHCLNSKMVVKVDDDVVVNLFKLLKMMTSGECCHNPLEIMCLRSRYHSEIFRKGSFQKWIVDENYFPNMTTYPFPYCIGFFTLIPTGVIPTLYEIATYMPVFWIDDVYLTGILVSQSNQIQLRHTEGVLAFKYEIEDCFAINKTACPFIAGLSYTIRHSQQIWNFVLKHFYEDIATVRLKNLIIPNLSKPPKTTFQK